MMPSDTIYVRETSDNSGKQVLSEQNGETDSLLSADVKDKEDPEMRRDLDPVRTKEEEHHLLLRRLQKRFIAPDYAKPAVSSSPRPSSHDLKLPKGSKIALSTGHMPSLQGEKCSKETDQLVNRLEEALRFRRPPFDVWENLLDKFSVIQQKQLVLNYANLEIAWSKNMASGDDEHGARFREHLGAFQELMDELSKEVLLLQGIDERNCSETLPRRGSSDQPDLEAFHAKLFRSRNLLESSASVPIFPNAHISSDSGRTTNSSPTSSSSFSSLQTPIGVRHGPSAPQRTTSSKTILSEPPRYPPPPVPLVQL